MYEALYPNDACPQGHPALANSLNKLGALLQDQGDYGGARRYHERALAMRQALYPRDRYPHGHPELVSSLNNLGYLLGDQGDNGGARGYLERALAMCESLYPRRRYPQGHPYLAIVLSNLGARLEDEGQLTAALPLLQRAVDLYQNQAELFQGASSEAECYDYLASQPGPIRRLVWASCRLPDHAEATYARVWRNKAAVARVLQRRQSALTLRAGADANTRRTLESWRDARRQIARLMLAISDVTDDPDRVQRLRLLTEGKERLERELAAAIPEFAHEQDLARSPHSRLIETLPAGIVVLDVFAFYRPERDPKVAGKNGWRFTPKYVGFVLAKGQPVQQVDLGSAQPIDEAIRAWRAAIVNRKASPAAEVVRQKVWEPLARQFPHRTTTVFITPDGPLTDVPWGALPGDRPGTVLLEQYALATVPHAPFVLDRLTAPSRSQSGGGLVLAVGGVDYDGTPKALSDPAARTDLLALRRAETERGRGPSGDGDGWKRLPGTGREVEAVAKRAGPRSLLRLEGTEASTARLLLELPRSRWAHIATHGFFADPKVRSILQPDPKLFAVEGRQRAAGLRNPLVLSGLVLAGANRPPAAVAQADQSADDLGIVTAEAIAGLPLPDLELVVLSACETGLGLVGGREGVFGLQRAFHLAGAQNVVASLWKVDDEATAALMAIFYDQLWRQRKPQIEALRTAQLTLYRHPERIKELAGSRGTPDFDKLVARPADSPASGDATGARRADAKDWAAFVLSGLGR
jgi:CHAT domain-containing protein